MFSLSSRIGLNLAHKPSMIVKPAMIRGIKTIPQPPGFIVGTVNDAYIPPTPEKTHGSYHWAFERTVAAGLVPLTIAPFFTGVSTVADAALSSLLLFHCYTGFQSCIIDYIPSRVYGKYHHYALTLLLLGTGVGAYGVYEIEKREGGVTNIISRVFKA